MTKGEVARLATQQSQRALRITSALRQHGWRTHWQGGESVPSDDDYRRRQAQSALDWARIVERDARTTRQWIESWARSQGAE